jgi:cation transport ATPase
VAGATISLLATVVGGLPIWKEAVAALLERRMTMELSMTIAIAIGAALAIGESFTASVIVLFVLVAEVLEHQTVGRGRRASDGMPGTQIQGCSTLGRLTT